ncbi:MAG: uroporphyrinogen decarboxylase family protein [Planctomycetota bacterium]|jgi:uroporphyrinogen decarboxylase
MQNDKQWIESVLKHEQGRMVPYNFMFSPPAQRRAEEHYGKNLEESLSMPLRMTGPDSIKPLYAFESEFGDTVRDEFGVVWSTSEVDRGSPIGPCIKEPNLSNYSFPAPSDEYRFEHIGYWCNEQQGHYRIIWVGDLWERATFMRGVEDLLMDVALNGEFVEELLDGITNYILQTMQILFEKFAFEGIAISDDYGTQKAMMISPEHWRRLIKPCLIKIYSLAKENNRTVFHHSCGNIVPIIGDMIDIGLDILHPIQPEAMDIFYLKKEFGDHLTFCGGIGTQDLLVSGAPEQIKDEIKKLKREMGKNGGYVLEPGITIQDDVPIENIIAMIDEARNTDY